MKRILIWMFCLSIAAVTSPANAFNVYRVGDEITARAYVDVLKQWTNRQFSIWVGIGDDGTEYIFFRGETGLRDADVREFYNQKIQQKLEHYIAKGIEWSGIAKQNNADTSKAIGCFGSDAHGLCAKKGNAFEANQMGVSFFANNGGRQTDLILDIWDRRNQFVEEQLYLNLSAMKQLERVVKQIPETFERARKTVKQQDLFQ